MEDVDHDIPVIEHGPLAVGFSVNAPRNPVVGGAELLLDLVADGAEVGFGGSRANHEEIRDRGNAPEIENDDVVCLLEVSHAGDLSSQFECVGQ